MQNCVGIDVSKRHLDWALTGEESTQHLPNTPAGVRRLKAKLQKLGPRRIVVESTGGYERTLIEHLGDAELPVVLVNPWRVRRFGEGLGVLAKTDRIDARMLALYGKLAQPTQRPLPHAPHRQMVDLVRRRRQLIAMIVAEKSRLDTAPTIIRRDIHSIVKILERRVKRLDERIDAAIAADHQTRKTRDILQSAPSVGVGVARTLIINLPELGSLGRREVASLVGVAPYAKDSGRKRGLRTIRAGRSAPRTALYLAAMNGARFNPILRTFYLRLRAAGKPPKLAFIALARKLLTILNAMVRDRTEWRYAAA